MVLVVALGAAVLLAVGFVVQQHEAAQLTGARVRPGLLLVLVRHPVWLAGVTVMVAGQVLGATALGMGSLVVVEPVLATNVLFALPLGAAASRRRLQRADWVGAVSVVLGLALLLGVGAPRESVDPGDVATPTLVLAASVLTVVVAGLVLASVRLTPRTKAVLLATAAGTVFGLQDFLTQRTLLLLDAGVGAMLSSWRPWTLVAVAVVGLTLSQNAFGAADLSASLPALTLAEPVCGMALAAALLHQGLRTKPLLLAAALVGLALIVVGIVLLARSPLVADPHGRRHLHHGHRHHHLHHQARHVQARHVQEAQPHRRQ
jgi:drug/metabolite transporter (DMT)-like permease